MASQPNPSNDRRRRLAALARYATMLLLLAMFAATHLPANAVPRQVAMLDKLLHCLVYTSLAFSVLTSWELTIGQLRPQHYFTVWLVGTFYGMFDEITQIPVGRHADINDWLSDIAGIVLGLTLYRLVSPLIYRLYRLVNLKFAV